MFQVVDVAREEAHEADCEGDVQRVEDQRCVGALPHLGYAVGYEFEGGGFVAFGAGEVGVELGDAGEGVLVHCC